MSEERVVFAGYEVVRCVGSGGMGRVYLAQHPRLPRQVALKILKQEYADNAEFRSRFLREAALAAQLQHPAIVEVYDCGEENGRFWIAMQYVDGTDAAQLVRAGRLALPEAVRVIATVAGALDYLHTQGVLHRDVKPANILVPGAPGLGPPAYLADFGVGRSETHATRLTAVDSLVGSIDYTAPERLTDADSDARADQYSLGCTAFHLLTGQQPYPSEKIADTVRGHLVEPVPSATRLEPRLRWPADVVLARAMSKRPEDRYASCLEFATDLAAVLNPHPRPSRARPAVSAAPAPGRPHGAAQVLAPAGPRSSAPRVATPNPGGLSPGARRDGAPSTGPEVHGATSMPGGSAGEPAMRTRIDPGGLPVESPADRSENTPANRSAVIEFVVIALVLVVMVAILAILI